MQVREQQQALYALQQMDTTIDDLKKRYMALDRGDTERAAWEAANTAHEEAAAALRLLEAELHDMELEQKGVEAKRASEETRLYSGKIQNPKELQSLQDEVDMLARQRTRLDEKILEKIAALETLRARENHTKRVFHEAALALQAKIDGFNAASALMKGEAEKLSPKREALAKKIPADLLRRYGTLRSGKYRIAIAAVMVAGEKGVGKACGVCKNSLSARALEALHDAKILVTCENCGRLLFEEEAKAE